MASDLRFIPLPILDATGQSLHEHSGRLWELGPWMAGTAELSRPPAIARVRAAFTGLAALHERLSGEQREGSSPGLARRADAMLHLLRGGFGTLKAAIELERRRDPAARSHDTAMRWLRLAHTLAPSQLGPLQSAAALVVRLQPCLRDARPEHFLFESDHLSGLVDFGAMGVDCVAADLARLLSEWLPSDRESRAVALASYDSVRPLGPSETALITAFENSASLLLGESWLRWHYLEHRHFTDPDAVASGIARGLCQLERLSES
jgi:Ser/Thr protein kinase RdoA (MazF antagonist)